MVRRRRGGAPGSLARGAVAVATAWALAWSGVPTTATALQEGEQGQEQGFIAESGVTSEVSERASSLKSLQEFEGYVAEESAAGSSTESVSPDFVEEANSVSEGTASGDNADAPLQTTADNIANGTWGTCSWEIDSGGTLRVHSGKGANLGSKEQVPWSSKAWQIKAAVFDDGVELPQNCGCMFFEHQNLASVNTGSWDTSSVSSMSQMFWKCYALKSLDVSKWNVSAVKDMSGLFGFCEHLDTLNISAWNTSSAEDFSTMFIGCSALKRLDIGSWNTSRVNKMFGVFGACSNLEELDVSRWNVSNVTGMDLLFADCSSLTTMDLSKWNTSSAVEMQAVFGGCSSLTSLNVSSWNTSRATDMSEFFTGCASLTSLDLSSWNTSAVTTNFDMFYMCSPDSITVGPRYVMAGHALFPEAKNGGKWLSSVTDQWLTASEIMWNRSGRADIYTQAGPIDISHAMVKRSWSTFIYDGTPKTPGITVVLPLLDYRTLNPDTDYTLSFSNNVNPGTATVTVTGKGNYKGTVSAVFRIINPKRVEMYRLYNPYSGEHFYTASADEKNHLASIGWNYEGVGWVAPDSSDHPVYRLYNPYAGDHHYTTSVGERDALKAVGWNDEGTGWYSDDAHSVPLYRQYNPYATVGTHNYTTSKGENDMLVSVGWNAEGIGWYGLA